MADFDLSSYEGRQAARDAGNWVGTDSSGTVVMEPAAGGGGSSAPSSGGDGAPPATTAGGEIIYLTVNGPRTMQQMQTELMGAGWGGISANSQLSGRQEIIDTYARTTGGGVTSGSGSNSTGAVPGTVGQVAGVNQNQAALDELGRQIDALYGAMQAGNAQAFAESVRRFNATFGLDQQKLAESVRQFNSNLEIAQSGLTGTFQGQQTLAAQHQQYEQQLGVVNAAAAQQANPFRQAQVIGQLGGLLGGRGVAGFQAPGQAQGQTDFSGMGNLQRLIDDIRGGPNAINSQSTSGILDAIPTPNKLNSVEFARSSPMTQSLVLQGMTEKYGLSPDDALAQIKATLPQFTAPTTVGGLKR